jgi:hypothetical protein
MLSLSLPSVRIVVSKQKRCAVIAAQRSVAI